MTELPALLIYVTIFAMALVTYITRSGGLFIVSRISPSPRVRAFLQHMPSSILVAIIIPTLAGKGPSELLAAAAAALAAILTRNLIVSIISGLLAVSILRNFVFT
ncbi:AzlD family protein [Desulfonatronovibrio magnus]|uniref:AzlD family protein n=1 Tax=Desulfonatronovibrio magnus TaxID=698827 RepID=UPI0005EBC4FE|nr:AzlD domain-containing protein [Desulfonatronovibrio magnus]